MIVLERPMSAPYNQSFGLHGFEALAFGPHSGSRHERYQPQNLSATYNRRRPCFLIFKKTVEILAVQESVRLLPVVQTSNHLCCDLCPGAKGSFSAQHNK